MIFHYTQTTTIHPAKEGMLTDKTAQIIHSGMTPDTSRRFQNAFNVLLEAKPHMEVEAGLGLTAEERDYRRQLLALCHDICVEADDGGTMDILGGVIAEDY